MVRMPETRSEGLVFSIIMSVTMTLGMEVYNLSCETGGASAYVLKTALKQACFMVIFVFAYSELFGTRLGKKLALRHIDPSRTQPFIMTLLISACTVLVMCPVMSLTASVIFKGGINSELFFVWLDTLRRNFPMAFLWQMFAAGPFTRWLFGLIYSSSDQKASA
jgi:hypothetical protein